MSNLGFENPKKKKIIYCFNKVNNSIGFMNSKFDF